MKLTRPRTPHQSQILDTTLYNQRCYQDVPGKENLRVLLLKGKIYKRMIYDLHNLRNLQRYLSWDVEGEACRYRLV